MKRAYDRSVNPPAPVADVVVAHPVSGASSAIRGKLDIGADVTVIPQQLVTRLGLTPKGHTWARGFDGSYSRRPVYYISLTVEGFTIPSVRCIAADRRDALLGRNVLNRFVVTLDGKSLTFEMRPA
jgi:predicted aspartyl protease